MHREVDHPSDTNHWEEVSTEKYIVDSRRALRPSLSGMKGLFTVPTGRDAVVKATRSVYATQLAL